MRTSTRSRSWVCFCVFILWLDMGIWFLVSGPVFLALVLVAMALCVTPQASEFDVPGFHAAECVGGGRCEGARVLALALALALQLPVGIMDSSHLISARTPDETRRDSSVPRHPSPAQTRTTIPVSYPTRNSPSGPRSDTRLCAAAFPFPLSDVLRRVSHLISNALPHDLASRISSPSSHHILHPHRAPLI